MECKATGYFKEVLLKKGPFFGVQGKFSYRHLELENSLWSVLFIEIDLDGMSNFSNKKKTVSNKQSA